jgi:hypothetical protein
VNDVPISTFEKAIQATHSAKAKLLAHEMVHESFKGDPVWEGEVLVFELLDHPSAHLCYAWEVDGIVTAVLGEGPVKSAADAVRASIMAG